DLVPDVQRVVLDGKELPASAFQLVRDPDGASKWRVVNQAVAPGHHTLELEYALPLDQGRGGPSFQSGGAAFDLDLNDAEPRHYLERYFPSNASFDEFPM